MPARDKIHFPIKNALIYGDLFTRKAVQLLLRKYSLSVVVIDIDKEEIVRWIN